LVSPGSSRSHPLAKVHVDPLAVRISDFTRQPIDVVDLEDDSEIGREVGEHGIEFAPLEETRSRALRSWSMSM